MANMDLKGAKSVPLVDRLDEYYEDVDMLNVVNFSPIPCKPLFFDIALNHVEFPSLDHKLESAGAAAGPAGCQAGSGAGGSSSRSNDRRKNDSILCYDAAFKINIYEWWKEGRNLILNLTTKLQSMML